MRKRLVRRALAAAGVMAIVGAGLAVVSSPAGATPGWNYSNVDCKQSRITVSVGGFLGVLNGNGGNNGSGADVYSIRTYCGTDFVPGQLVYDTDGNPSSYVKPDFVHTDIPAVDGPRQTQVDNYTTDLNNLYNRIFMDYNGPAGPAPAPDPWTAAPLHSTWADPSCVVLRDGVPDNSLCVQKIAPWYDAHTLALKTIAAIDQFIVTMQQYTPVSGNVQVWSTGWWTMLTGQYALSQSVQLRNGATVSGSGSWGGYYQDVNATVAAQYWPGPGFAQAIGQGGVLAGCGAGAAATVTGGANSSKLDETFDANVTAGCGITGGSSSGVLVALTGITIDYKMEFGTP
jgi:hypothetical protein